MDIIYVFEKMWQDDETSGDYFAGAAKTLEGAFNLAKGYVWKPKDEEFALVETDGTLWRVFYEGEKLGEISKYCLEE